MAIIRSSTTQSSETRRTPPKVLTIAGSDSGGGAGIQADLKTISALGCYGMSVITAVTSQNTIAVRGVYPLTAVQVGEQIRAVLDDLGADTIKIGMLFSPEIIRETASCLVEYDVPYVVLDPVMIAKSGDRLLQNEAAAALVDELFPLATVITPNVPEAVALTGILADASTTNKWSDHAFAGTEESEGLMVSMATRLQGMGAASVVMKGGHLEGAETTDYLFHRGEMYTYRHPRVDTPNTHGTGCTYSSAIASFLARGYEMADAVRNANQWLYGAIVSGADYRFGEGHGPVDHFYCVKEFPGS